MKSLVASINRMQIDFYLHCHSTESVRLSRDRSTNEVEEDLCLRVWSKTTRVKDEKKKERDMRHPCTGMASGKSLQLTGYLGENCFSQSPKNASNSSPSGRASKSISCRIWCKPMSSRLLWIKTTKLLMSLYKKQHSIHWLSFKLFISSLLNV